MSQTQLVSTAVAAEFVQSVGVELTIFAISIVLAVTFRGAAFGKQISGCQQALNEAYANSTRSDQNGAVATGRSSSPGSKREHKPCHEAAHAMVPTDDLSRKIESMINFASRRQAAEALAIYEVMRATGEYKVIKDLQKTKKLHWRPADVYGLLVQCAGNVDRPELIEILLDDMMAADIDRPLALYEAAMKILASKKCHKQALSVCSRLEADGLEPSPVTLSCLVSFAAEIGDADRAISFFNRLEACSMPSIRAYMTILRVHSKRGRRSSRVDWEASLAVIRSMQRRQAPIDSLVLNIVLSTGIAACQLAEAKALLEEFAKVGIVDVVSYNAVMKGLAQQKDFGQAIALLDEMSQSGVKPNNVTFNTAIDAAVRGSSVRNCSWFDAWRVLERMRDAGLAPDKFTCTTLMKGLQNGATSEQLTAILDLLKNVTGECSSSLWSFLFRSVIEAAAQVNNPALTTRAIAQMREQRVMLTPQEHQRLLRALLRDA